MDEARRTALTAEYEDAKDERTRLDVYIQTLASRLGISEEDQVTEPGDGRSAGQPGASGLTDDVASLVYANEFHGMSYPKAAEETLRRWSPSPVKRPIKTTQLVEALRKGGIDVKEPRPVYRSLYSSPRFYNLKGGQWGFAEWYPERAVKAARSERDSDAAPGADGADLDPSEVASDLAGPPTPLPEEAVS